MANDLVIANWAASISRELAPVQRRQEVVSFALAALAAAQVANRLALGFSPAYRTLVNGSASTALDQVRLDGGSIEFDFDITFDVLQWIAETLRARSPVGPSGSYRDGWTLLADGVEIDPKAPPAAPAQEYTFVNPVPYARKIEVGVTKSGRNFVVQVPNRIAERTAKDAAARFGNIAKVTSEFISLEGGYTLTHDQAYRFRRRGRLVTSRKQRADRVAGTSITYPAVIVKGFSNG